MPRPVPEPAALGRAVEVLRSARRPLVIAGGGVIYSEASQALLRFAAATGIPVSDTQAGKGALAWDHPCAVGGVGATGSPVANALAADADVVLGVGTRYSDFTTASRTAFQHPDVRFVNLNVAAFDAGKHAGVALVADARAGLAALTEALAGYRVDEAYTIRFREHNARWRHTVDQAYHLGHQPRPAQTEIVTAVSERIKLNIVLVQNQGFGSIGSLSESLGSQRFGTRYRYRDPATGLLDGDVLPVDLAANAASLGADVLRTATVREFAAALEQARASDRTTVVYIETDPLAPVPSSESWWDVPVSETSALESTQQARAAYQAAKRDQRLYL